MLHGLKEARSVRVLTTKQYDGTKDCRNLVHHLTMRRDRLRELIEDMLLCGSGHRDVKACLATEVVVQGGRTRARIGQDRAGAHTGVAVLAEAGRGHAQQRIPRVRLTRGRTAGMAPLCAASGGHPSTR